MNPGRGEIWWADLGDPIGSEPRFRRPVVVLQTDALNASRLATVICIPLSTNLILAGAPGNIALPRATTRLPQDSVANVSQIVTIDKSRLTERVAKLPPRSLDLILAGLDLVLGR